jgi:hypothetical protein
MAGCRRLEGFEAAQILARCYQSVRQADLAVRAERGAASLGKDLPNFVNAVEPSHAFTGLFRKCRRR